MREDYREAKIDTFLGKCKDDFVPAIADILLNQVFRQLNLHQATPDIIYQNINKIVDALQLINLQQKIKVGTTGTITERLCEYGLKSVVPDIYRKLGDDWKWIGDFYIEGAPFNTIITVKSFKARERLLSSGTGNLLSPSIGYGLFNRPDEFSKTRLESYLFRAFFIVFMPENTLNQLSTEIRNHKNINQNPLLRSIDEFPTVIGNAIVLKRTPVRGVTVKVLDPRKL